MPFLVAAAVPLVDIRDAMHSWYKENEQKGDLKAFPKWALEWNLYDKAYAMAQLQVAKPVLQSLDLIYQTIEPYCDGKYIKPRDITNVFARTSAGVQFWSLLETKNIVGEIKDATFNDSCKAVYGCYFRKQLEAKKVEMPLKTFSDDVFQWCLSIVDNMYQIMYQRATTMERMKNINYGDDFLLNAKAEDSPYDLLLDVEAIGDVLFAHNDNPSEIHFYDMQPEGSYVYNDPDKLTPYPKKDPEKEERMDRIPVTNGITPTVPKEENPIYPQNSTNPVAQSSLISLVTPKASSVSSSSSNPAAQAGWWTSAGWTIQNALCEEEVVPEEESLPLLDLAEIEDVQTKWYNRKLALEDEIAVALAAKMPPDEEEQLWVYDRGWNDPPAVSPPAQQEAETIFAWLLDLDGDSLQDTKTKIQQCVEQFTEWDKEAWWKILFKSITQPAEFTKCVFWHLCKEIGDPSGRWLYHIKICRELRKWYGIVSNQPVKSAEEVIDEMLNVCTNLKESGALLEHNKTKDHLENKMMRIKLGNKFAFGISVIFKWPRDSVDPAMAKRAVIQRRQYLEKLHLNFSDDLTFIKERNKYLVIQWNDEARVWNETNSMQTITSQKIFSALQATDNSLQTMSKTAESINVRASNSQLHTYANTTDLFRIFVEQNIQMWDVANQYTDGINKKRKTTLNLFQASAGKGKDK